MPELEEQIRNYADGVAGLVQEVELPPAGHPGRRWALSVPAAAVLVVLLVAAVVRLTTSDDRDLVATDDSGDVSGSPAGAGDCLAAAELEHPEGLVGAPVTEVLPIAMNPGFRASELWALPITGRELEGTWYAISTVVRDVGGRPLGTGLWLIPDPIVARAGNSWHLYAANDLAVLSSVGRPPHVSVDSSDLADAGECVGEVVPSLFVSGELPGGGAWIVVNDDRHGLCVTLRAVDLGCDDVGPVVPADAPLGTPRIAGATVSPEFSEDEGGELAYAELPEGAVSVDLRLSDGSVIESVAVDLQDGLWGAPVQSGNLPLTVTYLDREGHVVATFDIFGG